MKKVKAVKVKKVKSAKKAIKKKGSDKRFVKKTLQKIYPFTFTCSKELHADIIKAAKKEEIKVAKFIRNCIYSTLGT